MSHLQKLSQSIVDNSKVLTSFEVSNKKSKNKLSIITEELDSLLPCEIEYSSILQKEKDNLQSYNDKINRVKKYTDAGYTQLSTEPLKWCVDFEQGFLPRFAVINIKDVKNPCVRILSVSHSYCSRNLIDGKFYENDLPKFINKIVSEVSKSKLNHGYHPLHDGNTYQYFEATFSGKIPKETKSKIKEAQKHFGENNVYMIFEPKWERKVVAKPADPDPLIVGIYDEEIWLVDLFDATPAEQAFANLYRKTKDTVESTVEHIFKMVDI